MAITKRKLKETLKKFSDNIGAVKKKHQQNIVGITKKIEEKKISNIRDTISKF